MTLQDALVAYSTYARAEGKSPKTISWVTSSVTYFAEFLGPRQQDIGTITGNDLRRFIITRSLYSHTVVLSGYSTFTHNRFMKKLDAGESTS